MGWNYLSIPKLQQCSCWSLGTDEEFHPTCNWACDYLSMNINKHSTDYTDILPHSLLAVNLIYFITHILFKWLIDLYDINCISRINSLWCKILIKKNPILILKVNNDLRLKQSLASNYLVTITLVLCMVHYDLFYHKLGRHVTAWNDSMHN